MTSILQKNFNAAVKFRCKLRRNQVYSYHGQWEKGTKHVNKQAAETQPSPESTVGLVAHGTISQMKVKLCSLQWNDQACMWASTLIKQVPSNQSEKWSNKHSEPITPCGSHSTEQVCHITLFSFTALFMHIFWRELGFQKMSLFCQWVLFLIGFFLEGLLFLLLALVTYIHQYILICKDY